MKERVWLVFSDKVIEVRNISEDPHSFEVDPVELYRLMREFGEPTAIVHTHERSCEPSPADMKSMRAWRITWIIISKKCIKAFRLNSDGSPEEVDVDPLLLKVLNDLIVELGE